MWERFSTDPPAEHSPNNQVMLWRSGNTPREPALLVRLDCAIMSRPRHATTRLAFTSVVTYQDLTLSMTDYNYNGAFLQCPDRVRRKTLAACRAALASLLAQAIASWITLHDFQQINLADV